MNVARDRGEHQSLERMAARLFGLAMLARRVSRLPHPIRFLVLWVMRCAEATTRTFILELAQERGFWVDLQPQLFFDQGCDRSDAMRVAHQFQTLGELLEELLCSGLCDYASVSGKLKPAPEPGIFDRLRGYLQSILPIAINRPRWDSS